VDKEEWEKNIKEINRLKDKARKADQQHKINEIRSQVLNQTLSEENAKFFDGLPLEDQEKLIENPKEFTPPPGTELHHKWSLSAMEKSEWHPDFYRPTVYAPKGEHFNKYHGGDTSVPTYGKPRNPDWENTGMEVVDRQHFQPQEAPSDEALLKESIIWAEKRKAQLENRLQNKKYEKDSEDMQLQVAELSDALGEMGMKVDSVSHEEIEKNEIKMEATVKNEEIEKIEIQMKPPEKEF